MKSRLLQVGFCLWLMLASGVHANCLSDAQLRGVNLSGAEFNSKTLPGLVNKNYVYPTRNDLAYFKAAGMNVIRLPFRWERIQRQTFAPLDAGEVAQIRRIVDWAADMKLCVILDLHNYGAYAGKPIGSPELPETAFIDIWTRIYEAFGNPETTAFGLMNEPSAMVASTWITTAQQTVVALRKAGSRHLILVGSGRWSGAHEFAKPFDGVSAADAFRTFVDPGHQLVIELHQYADANYSGTGMQCIEVERLHAIMNAVTNWAQLEKKQLFLGEFGVGRSNECIAALGALLKSTQNTKVWRGWTYWAAGAWWGRYPFSIQPNNELEAPQMTLIKTFLDPNKTTSK